MLQVPGGPELLVVLLVLFVLFGPVVLAVVAFMKYTDRDDDSGERVDELEARVAELEREVTEDDPSPGGVEGREKAERRSDGASGAGATRADEGGDGVRENNDVRKNNDVREGDEGDDDRH